MFNAVCLGVFVGTIEWMCIAVSIETAIGEPRPRGIGGSQLIRPIANCNNDRIAAFSQVSVRVGTSVDVISDVASEYHQSNAFARVLTCSKF